MKGDRRRIRNVAVLTAKCLLVNIAVILPNVKPPLFQVTDFDQHLQGMYDKIFLMMPDSI
jgi:dihydroorotase